ncbi:MAG: glycoside hydrolase family 15 protein, partial [Chitinivibrionia bacterium]|nr:glycoside hydrolase family 15 protein [Chitinivibrionia bacterium]
MARDIPIGNGRFLLNHDEHYQLRDIYFPYVGKENHTGGHICRFGIWVDGRIDWTTENWRLKLGYLPETLVTDVEGVNEALTLSFRSNDCVDHREDIFFRKMAIRNGLNREREIRLFFHQDFHILESATGDTAYYDPDEKAIIHYKSNRFFLLSGMHNDSYGIDQYATGVKEFRGFEGTWKDAEDGLLGGNAIAQGSIDSTLSFTVRIPALQEETVYFWMAAGKAYAEVSLLNKLVIGNGPEFFMG